MLIYIPNDEGSGLIFKWNKFVFATYAWNGRIETVIKEPSNA